MSVKKCGTCDHWEVLAEESLVVAGEEQDHTRKGKCICDPPKGYPMMVPPKFAGQPVQMAVNTVWPITKENERCGLTARRARGARCRPWPSWTT